MPKYIVSVPYCVWVDAIVEADDKESAIDAAFESGACLTSYCGNGGSDKLVGVHGSGLSVCCDDDQPLELDGICIQVSEEEL